MPTEQRRSPRLDRQEIADGALLGGAIGTFALAAVTVGLNGVAADRALLCLLILAVAAVGLVAGTTAAVLTAVMAAFSFDFFHVAPIRVLHGPTLAGLVAALLLVALATGRVGERR